MRLGRARGFSLVEMTTAIALSGVVTAAAVVVTVGICKSTYAIEQRTFAHEEAKTIVDMMATQALQVGGGLVRPWQAVSNGCFLDTAVEAVNGATCTGVTGGRRFDYLDINDGGGQANLSASVVPTSSKATVALSAGACPLSGAGWPQTGAFDVVLLPAKPGCTAAAAASAICTSPRAAGGGWRSFRATAINTTSCEITLAALTNGVDLGAVTSLGTTDDNSYLGGVIAVGKTVSWVLDSATHSLTERKDFDDNGTLDERLVSDQVFDLNVSFGYDASPADGLLDAGVDGPLWYLTLDTRSASTTGARDPLLLRMVRIAVTTGSKVSGATNTSALLGNPEVTTPGYYFQQSMTAVTMRNLLVFF